MTRREVFEYTVVRVVPRPERGELLNAGVILYSKAWSFLDARCALDVDRLLTLDGSADVAGVRRSLSAVEAVCRGDPAAGAVSEGDLGQRFRWLTAPRSTVVQPGPVHTGLTRDPEADLERLVRLLVW